LFPEEQYAITSVPDLLIEMLHALAEMTGDRALAERYQRVRREGNDQTVVDLSLDSLRSFCKARRCGVLLMLENLDRLLQDQIKKDSQISLLRKILIEEDWVLLIATSPTYLTDVTDPQKPFFEFFQVVVLDELSPEGVETLLRKRAELDGNMEFLAYLKRYRSRLRALYHFSGGNPRLTLMLYDLLSRQALTDVKIELDGLLNQLTPFYQDRMKEVGPQEAKVLTTIALLAEGVTPTELAEECRMDRTMVSAVLSRLEKAGYVRREPRVGKQTVYTIPERFFRIWHQMTTSRLARGRIQYLLDFFSTWYATPEERDEVWERLVSQFQEEAETGEDIRTDDISTYMDYIATVSEGTERFRRHFDRLRQHLQTGDVDYVWKELGALDIEFSENTEYFVHKGGFLGEDLKSSRMALGAFRRAVELKRDSLVALFNEGVALDKLRRYSEAQDVYERVGDLLLIQRGHGVSQDQTQFLLHLLREESDDRLIEIAAFLLTRTGNQAVCPELLDILKHGDPSWRRAQCAISLGNLRDPFAVPTLFQCLQDSASILRQSAATALGWIGASEAVPGLIIRLSDEVENVRVSAATALGRIGTPEAVPGLITTLNDVANAVRGSAATALGRIGASEAVPKLITCLSDTADNVRASAAKALGRIRASEAIPELTACLSDEANRVRGSAAMALGRIGAPEATSTLMEHMHQEANPITRGAFAVALGKSGTSEEAVLGLVGCLNDEAENVRHSVTTALVRTTARNAVVAGAEVVTCLAHALNTRSENTRIANAGLFLRAAFRSGNLAVVRAFVEGFVSGIDNGKEAFLPHCVALDFLWSNRDPLILSRQPPEMREAVELLVSLFDQAKTQASD
jgi:HEAT repeat protein/DNA-binding MarR family transcriptional regulator